MCSGCGLNVMVKDLKEHPQVCGKEVKRVSKTVPCFEGEGAGLHALRDIRNQLRSDNRAGPLWRMPRALERQIYSGCVGDGALKDMSRRNVSRTQRNQNQGKVEMKVITHFESNVSRVIQLKDLCGTD